jgi:AraC-like DNA-binding protein
MAFLRKDDDFCRIRDNMETFIRTLSAQYDHGHEIGDHVHGWGQLVYAANGAIHVTVAGQSWLIPSARAVWLPPGTPHGLRMRGATGLRTLYIPPERCTGLFRTALGIAVTALLRELILELVRIGHVRAADRFHLALGEAMLVMLARAERLPLSLSLPVDRRALQVAHAILADPARDILLETLALESGGSLRTIQRRFVDETGMSVAEWRQVARLMMAAALLLDGESVTEVAFASGYAGASAFIHAFRRRVGQTPSAFRAGIKEGLLF